VGETPKRPLTSHQARRAARAATVHSRAQRLQEALLIAQKVENGTWRLQPEDITILRRALEDYADLCGQIKHEA